MYEYVEYVDADTSRSEAKPIKPNHTRLRSPNAVVRGNGEIYGWVRVRQPTIMWINGEARVPVRGYETDAAVLLPLPRRLPRAPTPAGGLQLRWH